MTVFKEILDEYEKRAYPIHKPSDKSDYIIAAMMLGVSVVVFILVILEIFVFQVIIIYSIFGFVLWIIMKKVDNKVFRWNQQNKAIKERLIALKSLLEERNSEKKSHREALIALCDIYINKKENSIKKKRVERFFDTVFIPMIIAVVQVLIENCGEEKWKYMVEILFLCIAFGEIYAVVLPNIMRCIDKEKREVEQLKEDLLQLGMQEDD